MEKYNILIIEDNLQISHLIHNAIKNNPYIVDIAHSILQAQKMLLKKYYDLICLDLILPDGDGIDILKKIKKENHTKIIVISQKINIHDRVEVFENNADDYLPKPFFPQELNLRIKKLLRLNNDILRIKDIELNLKKHILIFEDYIVSLTTSEFLILKYIFEKEGFVKTDDLIKYLSSKKIKDINNRALNITIKRLKDKFRRRTGKILLKNRYGLGYYIE